MQKATDEPFPNPAEYSDKNLFMVLVDADGEPETVYKNYSQALFRWYSHWDKPFPSNFQLEVLSYMDEQLFDDDISVWVLNKVASL